jgi:hypothetical protein
MKKTIVLGTLAAALAAGYAQAGVVGATPLQAATITASYTGQANGMLGLDAGFAPVAGSDTTGLDPLDSGEVEFLSGDFLFGFDFSHAGLLTVFSNGPVPSGAYSARFDFGATLPAAITAFTLLDNSAIGGLPQLSLIDGHTIGLDLSGLTWNGDFASFSAGISFDAPAEVPEPAGAALLLTGLAGAALARQRKR